MSALPKSKLTALEYLAIERGAAFKSEFFRGEMFAMAGASRQHNRAKENLIIEIGSRIKGGRRVATAPAGPEELKSPRSARGVDFFLSYGLLRCTRRHAPCRPLPRLTSAPAESPHQAESPRR